MKVDLDVTDMSEIIELINKMSKTRNREYIKKLLHTFCHILNMDSFELAFIPYNDANHPRLLTINSPFSFLGNYYRNGLFTLLTPIISIGMKKSTPIFWRRVITECCDIQDDVGLEAMLLIKDAGFQDGITIPWHAPKGHTGLLSFMTRTLHSEQEWIAVSPLLTWFSMYVFEAINEIFITSS